MLKKIIIILSCFIVLPVLATSLASTTTKSTHKPPTAIEKIRNNQLTQLNQNQPAVQHPLPFKGWDRIKLNAFGNLDVHPKTMQKTLSGEENNYFALSNVGLNVDADLSQLFHTHIGVAYFNTNKGQGDRNNNTGLMLDDAYATANNFQQAPWFVEGGRFYLPFGQYNRYAIVSSLTQLLSIARETGVQVGVANWHHFTGSVYVAQGQLRSNNTRIQGNLNGGAALHYRQQLNDRIHVSGGAEYIYNMLDVNAISESDPFQTSNNSATPLFPTANNVYRDRVAGAAVQAAVGYRWFTLLGRYVAALKSSSDILNYYTDPNDRSGTAVMGARPRAWDLGARADFHTYSKPSEADYTYSRSHDTAGLFIFNSTMNHPMPESRYIAGYTIHWTSFLLTRFQWAHDWLYPVGEGDTGRQGDDVTVRLGVKW